MLQFSQRRDPDSKMIKAVLLLVFASAVMAHQHLTWPPTEHYDVCKEETGATDVEAHLFNKNKPALTELTQCFYGCVYKKIHLLNDDMTFNPAVMEQYIQKMRDSHEPKYSPEVTKKYMDMLATCVTEANKNPPAPDHPKGYCIAAKHFSDCAVEEMEIEV